MATRRLLPVVLAVFSLLSFAPLSSEEAAERKFPQRIEWRSDANALEYRVEVRREGDGGTTSGTTSYSTEATFLELSLPAGRYGYRVTAIDFLGREAGVSGWTEFEILKASVPAIELRGRSVGVLGEDGSLELDVGLSDVTEGSVVELVGETVEGSLSPDGGKRREAGSEVESFPRVYFRNVPSGRYRLRVTNPSGLSSESDVITVRSRFVPDDLKIDGPPPEPKPAGPEPVEPGRTEPEPEPEPTDPSLGLDSAPEPDPDPEPEPEEEEKPAEPERPRPVVVRVAAEEVPYVPREIRVSVGVGAAISPYDGRLADIFGESVRPLAEMRASYSPRSLLGGTLGAEVSASQWHMATRGDYADASLTMTLVRVGAVWRRGVFGGLSIALRASFALAALDRAVTWLSDAEGRSPPSNGTTLAPGASLGLALAVSPSEHFFLEAGLDFTHAAVGGMPTGFVSPFAAAGIRL